MEHEHSKKSKRRWVIWAAGGVGATVVVALLALHFSPLRYWQDPVASVHEFILVKTANTDLKRANVHLTIAESRFRDFTALSKRSPSSPWLEKRSAEMVAHDDAAMLYMDRAKKANLNIKSLVARLCDDLDNQYKTLETAKVASADYLERMSNYTWDVEASIDANGKFSQQLYDVRVSLSKAMSW